MPSCPRHTGHDSVVCCEAKHIDHIQPHNNFPAQSLHFRFGSAAPCPTLKPDVTASAPGTRYRRLAGPYLIGFSYCIVISLPGLAEFPPLARGNQLRWFHSSHLLTDCTIYQLWGIYHFYGMGLITAAFLSVDKYHFICRYCNRLQVVQQWDFKFLFHNYIYLCFKNCWYEGTSIV